MSEPASTKVVRRKIIGSTVGAGPMAWPARRYERFECDRCHGSVDEADNYCRWCGSELVTEPLSIVPMGVLGG